MWPFKKKTKPTHYAPIDYQVGDKVVCVNDRPHDHTHQALLNAGTVYVVRDIRVDLINPSGFGGPFVKLIDVSPVDDAPWVGKRFKKALTATKTTDITEQVLAPVFTPTEVVRERAEAGEVWG